MLQHYIRAAEKKETSFAIREFKNIDNSIKMALDSFIEEKKYKILYEDSGFIDVILHQQRNGDLICGVYLYTLQAQYNNAIDSTNSKNSKTLGFFFYKNHCILFTVRQIPNVNITMNKATKSKLRSCLYKSMSFAVKKEIDSGEVDYLNCESDFGMTFDLRKNSTAYK